ncbi:MAG: hypothetical protein GY943_22070, partial [Chloroflexi bacterium]|nr:hypothetical protein [Chloroflexota bacterium]
MIKRFLILILIIAATISACTTNEVVTPTPFPNDDTTTPIISSGQVVPVEIAQLVENPETFEGVTVLVNGRYHPLPARVCSATSYASPATWNLVAGEGNVYMNGFDSQLNALLPESTSMTVNGVWRQWNGPIGCG